MTEATQPTAVTRGIRVSVETKYNDAWSQPPYRYFFNYRITIANESGRGVKLLARRWIIKDAQGRVSIVEGEGVLGETPDIRPGHSYQYTSGCPLPTSYGEMEGAYVMTDEDGDRFEVTIPNFRMFRVEGPAN